MTYQDKKEQVRQKAIDWQLDFGNHDYSWLEVSQASDHFERLGRKYGLLTEFRDNGIC